jgi:hypothetical protein
MANERYLTIHFTDGSKLSVTFPKQTDMLYKIVSRVEKALDADKLAIEIGGELFVIPMNNIKYMQVSPAPDKLPESVVRGGSLISDY